MFFYLFLCYNLYSEYRESVWRLFFMAYFLKKNIKKDKVYLSIVNSFYDSDRRCAVHETYASFGTGQSLIDQGIFDPIHYLEEEVKRLNFELNTSKAKEISDIAPFKYAGHFLLKAILDKLELQPILKVYDLTRHFHFALFDVLSALIYARCIKPCSKYKTYFEVIPYLEKEYSFSYDQLLDGLAYFGDNYEKIVEIFTKLTQEKYGIHPHVGYFDCTNFYFEIDKEDDIRKKGPSKENRKEPLLGMGLLLDANQIPIGLKLFPGNESEKPKIREIIQELKSQNDIEGKIVQVADKGLNCARNIYEALINKDGYIFSKSCKLLPQVEKTWLFLENDYIDIRDKEGNILYKTKECIDDFTYSFIDDEDIKHTFKVKEKRIATYNPALAKKQLLEIQKLESKARELCLSKAKKEEYGECSKYVTFKGKDGEKAITNINDKKLKEDKQLCGYNLIVTSETHIDQKEIYKIYHNLWRIEESFRIMKSELDARPAYMKTKETIYGHFLICYLSVLLTRILQIYELNDQHSYQEIYTLIRKLKYVIVGNKYVNMATQSEILTEVAKKTKLPIKTAMITKKQYEKIMSYKL